MDGDGYKLTSLKKTQFELAGAESIYVLRPKRLIDKVFLRGYSP